MTRLMPFKDMVTLIEQTPGRYGKDVLGDSHEMPGAYEQTLDYTHGDSQDAVVSGSRLYLPGDNTYLVSVGYRIEGMIAVVNLFGATDAAQTFKISSCFPVRDTLLGNKVRHVECDLKKVSVTFS